MSDFLPPCGPEAVPAPESPSGCILERSTQDDWWEHDRDRGREYLGALIFWRPGCHGGKIERGWLVSDLHRALHAEIGAGFPWPDATKAIAALRWGPASKRFGATVVGREIEACCAATVEWDEVPAVVEALRDGARRRERVRLLTDALNNAHDKEHVDNIARMLLEV